MPDRILLPPANALHATCVHLCTAWRSAHIQKCLHIYAGSPDDLPAALYTGSRLKDVKYEGQQYSSLWNYAPDIDFTESVMLAKPESDGNNLQKWGKGQVVIAAPPHLRRLRPSVMQVL